MIVACLEEMQFLINFGLGGSRNKIKPFTFKIR